MAREQRGLATRAWWAWIASARADGARLAAVGHRARRAAASVGSGRREALIALAAYGVYSLVKGLWGGSLEEGRRAAASLVDLEKSLGIYVEPDLQRFFVDHDLGMPFWNAFYVVSQVVVLPLTLFLVYRYARGSYAFLRNMALLSWSAGLIWYALQPVAPPRLLASGFTDTVSSQTFFQLDSDFIRAFYNPVAAMPSLHVGMAPGGRLGADQAHALGLDQGPRGRLPAAGGDVDRGDRQPLHPRHRGRAGGRASGGRDLGVAGARAPAGAEPGRHRAGRRTSPRP